VHAAHIVMASAQRAVAAHSHAYEPGQSSSTTSYPVREHVEIGHDPKWLTLLNKGPGLPGRGQRVRAQISLHEPN